MQICLLVLLAVISCCTWGYEPKDHKQEQTLPSSLGVRFPCWSPDGGWIAFSLQGDIWKVPSSGGRAIRLTLHVAEDVKPRWSPDGKWIAFSSDRLGNFDIWIIPSEGGIPTQLTFHSEDDYIANWAPNGHYILFSSRRSGETEMWKVSKDGGNPTQLTYDMGRDGTVSPDGNTMVYTRGDASLWIRGYKGTSNWDIYSVSLNKNSSPTLLTKYSGNDLCPTISQDGKSIYYIREDSVTKNNENVSVYNIWKMDIDGQNPTQWTKFDCSTLSPNFSSDGHKVVFEKDFQLWQMSCDDLKPSKIDIDVSGDSKGNVKIKRILSDGNEMAHWAPDGKEIAFMLQNDIWIMPSSGGKAKQITRHTAKDQWPRFSPDGKNIAYCSDKSGNDDIFIYNLESKEERQLTDDKTSDFFHSWSPDGKWIIFTSERSGNRDIWMVESNGGIPHQITNDTGSEDDAVISPDGKWIAFDSAKSGNQEIWIMPMRGEYKEAKQLTKHEGLSQVPSWSPDSRWIAYEHNDSRGNTSIWIISVHGGKSMQVVADGSMPCWSPDGKWILYEYIENDIKNTMRIPAPLGVQFGEKLSFFAEITVDKHNEYAQIFEEAWNTVDREFYDEKFHGIDWKQIKKVYEPLAQNAQTDMELEVVINSMVGELRASHMGFVFEQEPSSSETGYLGCDLAIIPEQSVMEVKNILMEGPMDNAWVRNGDFVYEIGGQRTNEEFHLDKVLANTVGKEIKIFVSPTLNPYQGRYVTVKPIDVSDILQLRYQQWVRERLYFVRQTCGNSIVYVHLNEMNDAFLARFRQIVQKSKDIASGMILDIRNNGGGNIHHEILDIFIREPYLAYQVRGQSKEYQPTLYWNKPVVLLVNEKSFSDAEVLAYAFQQLKIGSVVGVATGGGVIGTKDTKMAGNSIFRIPRVGYYTLGNKNLEGLGVVPDVVVVETPQDRFSGQDPQLAKAIEIIIQKIRQSND